MALRTFARSTNLAVALRAPGLHRKFSTVLDTPVYPSSQRGNGLGTQSAVFLDALYATGPRTNWTKEEISELYHTSLIDLTYASVC
jgi:biotin synthase